MASVNSRRKAYAESAGLFDRDMRRWICPCPVCGSPDDLHYTLKVALDGAEVSRICECPEALVLEALGAEAAPSVRGGMRFLSGEDLLNLPKPDWRIDGILTDGLIVLYALPGSYKTFVALDLAASVAAGIPWLGRAVRQVPVVYVAAEGVAGLRGRYRTWLDAHGVKSVSELTFVADAVNLLDPAVMREVVDRFAAMPVRPALVVDTWARSLIGGDENSSRDAGLAIAALDALQPAFTLVVHHPAKQADKVLRGSGALEGAADVKIRAKRDRDHLVLYCEKLKDAQEWEPLRLRLRALGESLYITKDGDDHSAGEDLAARVLAALTEAGSPMSLNKLARKVTGRREQISAMLKKLEADGVIAHGKDGYVVVPDAREPPGTTPARADPETGSETPLPVGGVSTEPAGPTSSHGPYHDDPEARIMLEAVEKLDASELIDDHGRPPRPADGPSIPVEVRRGVQVPAAAATSPEGAST